MNQVSRKIIAQIQDKREKVCLVCTVKGEYMRHERKGGEGLVLIPAPEMLPYFEAQFHTPLTVQVIAIEAARSICRTEGLEVMWLFSDNIAERPLAKSA